MPKPASLPQLQQDLQSITGDVNFDRVYRSMHATDASVYQILPSGVVAPRSVADVVQVVNLCREAGVSITARGGGTSQAGQAIGAGISLDFSRYMNRLLALNVEERYVRVEPGMVLDELNAQLKPHGLQLPLDLSTSNRATIGGMIANNSAGTRSVIYGKTIDYVEELEVVLADGTQVVMGAMAEADAKAKADNALLEGRAYETVTRLALEHADEIQLRYPKIMRRVGGYNLDEFAPDEAHTGREFNLARMMVGSEGTLGLTVAAKLRVVPLPKQRTVCTVQFDDLLEAMRATPLILTHNPSAVELMDRHLMESTRGKIEFEPLRSFIEGDPGAVLIVEFFGDRASELPERMDRLEAALGEAGLGHHFYRAPDGAAQGRIWTLRKAALGLTMTMTGDAKSISFVEDTAVAPAHLHDYIESFQAILAKYDTPAAFYAHASVGLLHIRPIVNMKTADGVGKFEAIANEVADLVVEYGGALSGEHGDGLVRAPFQEKLFGLVLYKAFCEIKEAFDPYGLFNPGKIVHAPALTTDLRFGEAYETPEYETAFDFSDFGGLVRATEQCSGVGVCRKTLTGTMCPSYMATRNEQDSTRGRANALRQVLSGQLEVGGLGHEELMPALDLCLECKACKRECPTGVDMARIKSEYLHQHHLRNGTPLRTRALASAEQVARWGSRLAPVSNWLLQNPVAGWVNEYFFGLDRRRALPRFAGRSFEVEYQKHYTESTEDAQRAQRKARENRERVALFVDTFNNFYEPGVLMAAARMVEDSGASVQVAPYVCCGRPLISKGFLDRAARQAAATSQALLPLVEEGLPILFSEPSCYSAVVDDHPQLLRGAEKERAQRVAEAALLVDEWRSSVSPSSVSPASVPQSVREGPRKILVHGHCHQKALAGMESTVEMLSAIPNCEVTVLDSGCCGLAGLFGYEHYEVSQAIGEQRLFSAIRAMGADTVVVSPGFSCRQQIKHFTGVEALSPAEVVAGQMEHG